MICRWGQWRDAIIQLGFELCNEVWSGLPLSIYHHCHLAGIEWIVRRHILITEARREGQYIIIAIFLEELLLPCQGVYHRLTICSHLCALVVIPEAPEHMRIQICVAPGLVGDKTDLFDLA